MQTTSAHAVQARRATLLYRLIKALRCILDTNAGNISQWGGCIVFPSLRIRAAFINIESPREEICAFDGGVISAFSVGEPVFYGDETV